MHTTTATPACFTIMARETSLGGLVATDIPGQATSSGHVRIIFVLGFIYFEDRLELAALGIFVLA